MKGILFFILTSRSIRRKTEKAAAIARAKAKSSRLHQNPKPNPVTLSTSPSPIPIFPLVALLSNTTPVPSSNPNNLSSTVKEGQKGIQIHTSKVYSATTQTLIFLEIIS